MKKSKESGSAQKGERKAPVENEAIKNTEDISHDKKTSNKAGENPPDFLNYPANEDMLNPSNDMERVDVDVEKITRARDITGADWTVKPTIPPLNDMQQPTDEVEEEADLGIVPGTEADVTKEDLLLLGSIDQDMDLGEDEELQNKGFPLAQTGEDLDVPGEELDDADEAIGEEDEENNYYSLGGDNKDSLEEDQS